MFGMCVILPRQYDITTNKHFKHFKTNLMETTVKTKIELLNEAIALGVISNADLKAFENFPDVHFDNYVRPGIEASIQKKHAERVSKGYIKINDYFGTSVKFREALVSLMSESKITKITCELVDGGIVVKQSISAGKPIKTGERAQRSGKWEFTNGILTFTSLRSMLVNFDADKKDAQINGHGICTALKKHIKFTDWTARNIDTNETEKFDVWAVAQYDVKQS